VPLTTKGSLLEQVKEGNQGEKTKGGPKNHGSHGNGR